MDRKQTDLLTAQRVFGESHNRRVTATPGWEAYGALIEYPSPFGKKLDCIKNELKEGDMEIGKQLLRVVRSRWMIW